MDITLERILSLIPKNKTGKYLHGAKKSFAESIGYAGGEIVNMWENGSSKSYMGKLYEISSVHNVSVEWLRGETDDPTPREQQKSPPQSGELTGLRKEAWDLIEAMDEDTLRKFIKAAKAMLEG